MDKKWKDRLVDISQHLYEGYSIRICKKHLDAETYWTRIFKGNGKFVWETKSKSELIAINLGEAFINSLK